MERKGKKKCWSIWKNNSKTANSMEDFIVYCKQYIYDHIDGYRGQKVYLCDLGFTLTDGPNCDGTLTYSTEKAKEYLREWWWDAADYFEYEKDNFGGEYSHNPFENPEVYMVCMVIEGVCTLIDRAITALGLDDQWNDEVELTADLIEKIKGAVEEFNDDKLF